MKIKATQTTILSLLCVALLLSACGSGSTATGAGENAVTLESMESEGTALEIYCFSAGKADAFLLYTADSAVLIDAGEKGFGREILQYLEEKQIQSLDYMIITHFDQDHVGGAARILNNFPVKAVLQSNRPKDSEEYEKYTKALKNSGITPQTLREDFAFLLDGVAYVVNPPRKNSYVEDASNNSSLIVSVKNGNNLLLFTGDAEDARLQEFVAANETDYDFLKVPYHGRWLEMLDGLLDSTLPEYGVVTSSAEDMEDSRTLELLNEKNVETWLTRDGSILILCDGEGLTFQAVG